jgi:hypothetical protein
VVQVTPIEQLNSKAISVSNATQRTPANGDIVADKVGVAIVPTAPLHVYHNTTGEYAAIIDQDEPNAGHGLKVTSDGNGAGSILFDVESVSTSLLRVLGNGNVGIGCSPSYPLEVQSGGVGTVLRAGTSFVSIDSTGSAAAPSLILNGDADTGLWHPSANTLAIATAGTDRLTIDSGGDVLVGTGSANLIAGERALTVGAGTTGDVVGSVELQGSRTTDAYFGAFSMFHKANRVAEIRGNRDGADDAAALTFHTKATGVANAIERLRISSAGLATFANGIAFSNQTDASGTGITSGATTLQHYETGEWTPKYTSTGATWTTYYEQVGRYTRIGNMVSYSGRLRVNAAPTGTVSNSAIIDGLPFTSLNVIGTEASVTVGLQTFATTLSPAVTYGGTFITPYKSNTTSIIIASETTAAFFMFSGHYIAQ